MPIIGTGVPIIGLPQHLLVRLSLQNQICYGSETSVKRLPFAGLSIATSVKSVHVLRRRYSVRFEMVPIIGSVR